MKVLTASIILVCFLLWRPDALAITEPEVGDPAEVGAAVQIRHDEGDGDPVAESAKADDGNAETGAEPSEALPLDLLHALPPGYEVRRHVVWSD